jgi:predicted nucleic acid-binding protein
MFLYLLKIYFYMGKQDGEVSVFFYIPEEILSEFNEAAERKSKSLGVVLNKKQAYNLALKEIAKIWKNENPV